MGHGVSPHTLGAKMERERELTRVCRRIVNLWLLALLGVAWFQREEVQEVEDKDKQVQV